MERKSLIIRPFKSMTVTPASIARALWNHRDVITEWGSWAGTQLAKLFPKNQTVSGNQGRKGRKKYRNPTMGVTSGDFKDISVPVSRSLRMNNPMFLRFESLPQPIGDHIPGIRLILRQQACNVNQNLGNQNCLVAVAGGVSIDFSGAGFFLTPDKLNGRVALIARNFAKFAFRYIRLIYVPQCATSVGGGMNLCLMEDPNGPVAVSSLSPLEILNVNPSMSVAAWDRNELEYKYTGTETFHSEFSGGSSADVWETAQGAVIGQQVNQPGVNLQTGILIYEMILDLYGPMADYGFSEKILERVRASDAEWDSFMAFQKQDVVVVRR